MMAVAKAGKNMFAIWVSVAVVVAIVLVGALVVWMNNAGPGASAAPESPAVTAETGAITIGDGPDTVSLYQDYMCPHCQDFEAYEGETITQLLDDGQITLDLHPVALDGLDQASGTQFSTRSANATYCVADAGAPEDVWSFSNALFGMAPTGTGLTDQQLIDAASSVGVDIAACVEDGTYNGYISTVTAQIPENPQTGGRGTPTLLVNDEFVQVTGSPQVDLLDRLGN